MDNMDIKAGKESEVVQAGRDVNIQIGMSYDQIKSIFNDLFNLNFPKLVQEAAIIAQNNLDEYIEILFSKLKSNSENINTNKFQDPNIQFLINESIKQTARKGKKIELDLLSDLLITVINKSSTEIIENIASEALLVIPKLSKDHIAFLSYLHFVDNMQFQNVKDISQIESSSSEVLNLVRPSFIINDIAILHLSYIGLIFINIIKTRDIYQIVKNHYNIYNSTNNNEIFDDIKTKSPSYYELINHYKNKNYGGITLTSVGRMIALVNLKRVIPSLDYSIWIK